MSQAWSVASEDDYEGSAEGGERAEGNESPEAAPEEEGDEPAPAEPRLAAPVQGESEQKEGDEPAQKEPEETKPEVLAPPQPVHAPPQPAAPLQPSKAGLEELHARREALMILVWMVCLKYVINPSKPRKELEARRAARMLPPPPPRPLPPAEGAVKVDEQETQVFDINLSPPMEPIPQERVAVEATSARKHDSDAELLHALTLVMGEVAADKKEEVAEENPAATNQGASAPVLAEKPINRQLSFPDSKVNGLLQEFDAMNEQDCARMGP